jgi:hypothetical protein
MNMIMTNMNKFEERKRNERRKKITQFNVQILSSSVEDVYVYDVDDANNESNHHPLKQ